MPPRGVGSQQHMTAAVVRQARRHQARACALSRRRPGDQRSGRRPHHARLARLDAAHSALQGRHAAAPGAKHRGALAEPAGCADLSGGRASRFALDQWLGVFVPAGTPPAIAARLNAEMNKALNVPPCATCSSTRRRTRSAARPSSSPSSSMRISRNTPAWSKELNIKVELTGRGINAADNEERATLPFGLSIARRPCSRAVVDRRVLHRHAVGARPLLSGRQRPRSEPTGADRIRTFASR